MNEFDRLCMKRAIAEARDSVPEDARVHPKVGVVVAVDGNILATAHRGEFSEEHAEYVALERKLAGRAAAGATVYTTLEPCVKRNPPKLPCAQHITDHRIRKVFCATVDPNPMISGKGILWLRQRGIEVATFEPDLAQEVEELNRDFIRFHQNFQQSSINQEFIEQNKERAIDEWFRTVNRIYKNVNFERDTTALFAHLVEVTGGLSLLASHKTKPGVVPEEYVAKALAWWFALCGKVGIESVSKMIWAKFPGVCPYCLSEVHVPADCAEAKGSRAGPDWNALTKIGNGGAPPKTLGDWQRMFLRIYPAQQTEEYGISFARLTEELGELSEAIRVFSAAPTYFLSEAADVFAWLMHVQNLIDQKNNIPRAKRGANLEKSFCRAYPDRCLSCDSAVCSCPPILDSTIGRIAHDAPLGKGFFIDR